MSRLVSKYMKGSVLVMTGRYETTLPLSTRFPLTTSPVMHKKTNQTGQ
jgi:hypothetical protein